MSIINTYDLSGASGNIGLFGQISVGNYLWVMVGTFGQSPTSSGVLKLDKTTGAVVATITFPQLGGTATPSGYGLTYSNGYIWVGSINYSNYMYIQVINPNSATLVNTIEPGGAPLASFSITSDTQYVWTFGPGIGLVQYSATNPFASSYLTFTNIPTVGGINPYDYACASDGTYIWTVSNGYLTQLSVSSTPTILNTVNFGISSYYYSIVLDGTYLWIGSDSNIIQITQNSTPTIVNTLSFGASNLMLSGDYFYASTGSSVNQINKLSQTLIQSISIPNGVNLFQNGLLFDSGYVWVSDSFQPNSVTLLQQLKFDLPVPVICFLEGSKILCMEGGYESYVAIEHIRKGTLVKTESHGFVPVHVIGRKIIENPAHSERVRDRLYKLTPAKYPELKQDLIITGDHSILVKHLTEKQRADILEASGDIWVTEGYYRLMAFLDERAEIYEGVGEHSIWHLALDNNEKIKNYGIYANGGLLVESTSIRFLKEISDMTLIH
jgi:hypothetical protein